MTALVVGAILAGAAAAWLLRMWFASPLYPFVLRAAQSRAGRIAGRVLRAGGALLSMLVAAGIASILFWAVFMRLAPPDRHGHMHIFVYCMIFLLPLGFIGGCIMAFHAARSEPPALDDASPARVQLRQLLDFVALAALVTLLIHRPMLRGALPGQLLLTITLAYGAARGLATDRVWGPWLALLQALATLFMPPVGTALGVLLLLFLARR